MSIPVSATDPVSNPGSAVPPEFTGDMDWSEQGEWHWVVYPYSGANATTAVTIQPSYFVATRVRTLAADDPCSDCMPLNEYSQGPPLIKSGFQHPALRDAYANLDNGARYKLSDSGVDGEPELWAAGSWYLNYNPVTGTFFSWTWIPEVGQEMTTETVESSADSVDMVFAFDLSRWMNFTVDLPEGTRVFPMAPGTYQITQDFGCVAHNHGYPSSPACPPDRPSFHYGTDFGAPEGTKIYAAASGTVTFADIDPSNASGNSMIVIMHDGMNGGYRTEYLHWRKTFVRAGDYVVAGQVIAEVGSIGYSTGPHLHFSVIDVRTGVAIDPMIWLQSSVAPPTLVATLDSGIVANVLRWEPLIRASAERFGIPVALIAAIMTVESSGNPNVISPAGAQGLMQVMPANLARYGIPPELWLDPATNIDAGARHLAESLSSGVALEEAVARYFGFGCDVFGTCTGQYVALVWSWYAYYVALFAGDPLPLVVQTPVIESTPLGPPPTAPQQAASSTSEPAATENEAPEDPPAEESPPDTAAEEAPEPDQSSTIAEGTDEQSGETSGDSTPEPDQSESKPEETQNGPDTGQSSEPAKQDEPTQDQPAGSEDETGDQGEQSDQPPDADQGDAPLDPDESTDEPVAGDEEQSGSSETSDSGEQFVPKITGTEIKGIEDEGTEQSESDSDDAEATDEADQAPADETTGDSKLPSCEIHDAEAGDAGADEKEMGELDAPAEEEPEDQSEEDGDGDEDEDEQEESELPVCAPAES
jgi:murein DD-endopeptidase MepM/ murein hydrolase activator NlpD